MDKVRSREKLIEQLKDERYRDAFVSEHIDTGIPFQIRAIRKQRKWTQKELADNAGMLQERISVAENPNYAKFNLKTLKKIASAFGVALVVRFVPISELVEWELNLSSKSLEAIKFEDDPYFQNITRKKNVMAYPQAESSICTHVATGGFLLGREPNLNIINPPQSSQKVIPFPSPMQKEPTPIQKAGMGKQ